MRFAIRRTLARTVLPGLALLAAAVTACVTVRSVSAQTEMRTVTPAQLQWVDAPPGLPPGAKVAILQGDPTKPGPFTLRFRVPAGYKVPAHWHPTDENVTVLKGTLRVGKGEKFEPSTLQDLPAGSFMRMPKTMRHYAQAKGETILQLHGIGPFEIHYVNPGDDPRKKALKK